MHAILDERDKALFTSELDMIEDNVFVVSKSGSGMIVSDCTNDPPKGLRVFGKTEQKTTSGNQLLKYPYTESNIISNGITITSNDDGSINLKGTNASNNMVYFNLHLNSTGKRLAIKAGTYTISCVCPVGVNVSGNIVDSDGNKLLSSPIFISPVIADVTFTINSDGELYLYTYVEAEKTVDHVLYIMLNSGTTALPWEPYTGGMPSPNPEYPQELVNSMIEEVGMYGGNLLDLTKFSHIGKGGSVTSNGITFTNVDNECIKVTGTAETYVGIFYTIDLPKGTYVLSGVKNNARLMLLRARVVSGGKWADYPCGSPFVVTDEVTQIQMMIQADTGWVVDAVIYPMLNIGTEPLPYEPYKPKQSLMVSTPNGLPGIKVTDASLATYTDSEGNMWCSDEKDYERGVYVQRVYRLTCNGYENWKTAYSDNPDGNRFEISLLGLELLTTPVNANDSVVVSAVCNALSYHKTNGHPRTNSFRVVVNNNRVYILANPSLSIIPKDDVTAWTEFLNKNNIEILLLLATPIETPLSEEELAQYKALTMNYPNTTIINNTNAHMEVDYVADIKNHIEQNYVTREEAETLLSRVSTIEEVMV